MPHIAAILKSEISRVARNKEVRTQTTSGKKISNAHRRAIADLRKRAQALEQQPHPLAKTLRAASTGSAEGTTTSPKRFSAQGLKSMRKRRNLSAEACRLLIGASSQSVYSWEQGKARPHARHLTSIASLRSLDKKGTLASREAPR